LGHDFSHNEAAQAGYLTYRVCVPERGRERETKEREREREGERERERGGGEGGKQGGVVEQKVR
jgi:hypothetical protein